jgi:hypothetical protein
MAQLLKTAKSNILREPFLFYHCSYMKLSTSQAANIVNLGQAIILQISFSLHTIRDFLVQNPARKILFFRMFYFYYVCLLVQRYNVMYVENNQLWKEEKEALKSYLCIKSNKR